MRRRVQRQLFKILAAAVSLVAVHGGCTVATGDTIQLSSVNVQLRAAAPNPFSSNLTIAYQLTGESADSIILSFKPTGSTQSYRYVFPSSDSATISSFRSSSYPTSAGYSEFVWDAATAKPAVANGTYTYTLTVVKGNDRQSVSGTVSRVAE